MLLVGAPAWIQGVEIQIFPYQDSDGPSLHILGMLEEEGSIQAVWVEGPNLFLHIDIFQDGRAFFGAGRIPSPLPEGDTYRLNLRLGDQTLQFPLVGLGGLLFPKGGLRLESKVTERTRVTVQPGDWLYQIAREHETTVALIQWINEIDDLIVPGQVLRIGTVSFGPSPLELRILLGRCLLQVVYQDQVIREYPVAVGRGTSTPVGTFHIARKVPEPMLYWQGQALQPLSPINGLGIWWVELNNPQYGIHGTTRPWEIGKRISHGCIRMFNHDIDHLQSILAVGTPVHIRP